MCTLSFIPLFKLDITTVGEVPYLRKIVMNVRLQDRLYITRDLAELREYVENYLQDRFTRVDEVATVLVSGGTERIVQRGMERLEE